MSDTATLRRAARAAAPAPARRLALPARRGARLARRVLDVAAEGGGGARSAPTRARSFCTTTSPASCTPYVSTDLGSSQIRLLDNLGIVGAVYRSGVGEIVHDAYADQRFHREIDEQTGFTTESILCAPIKNAKGETIGVAELLNKVDGALHSRRPHAARGHDPRLRDDARDDAADRAHARSAAARSTSSTSSRT